MSKNPIDLSIVTTNAIDILSLIVMLIIGLIAPMTLQWK